MDELIRLQEDYGKAGRAVTEWIGRHANRRSIRQRDLLELTERLQRFGEAAEALIASLTSQAEAALERMGEANLARLRDLPSLTN